MEQPARAAGVALQLPFWPGRTDVIQEQTEAANLAVLEPEVDGFCNGTDVPRAGPT
ncbi:MAG: hypothetical protein HXY19_09660 [Thermoanaerobaculaceae bacterium]|nr:hypothetical protein [Thermoanaerobaculaceae bacterium]